MSLLPCPSCPATQELAAALRSGAPKVLVVDVREPQVGEGRPRGKAVEAGVWIAFHHQPTCAVRGPDRAGGGGGVPSLSSFA